MSATVATSERTPVMDLAAMLRAVEQAIQDGTWKRCPIAYAYTDGVQGNPAGRNVRSVWEIATHSFPGAHFAVFPMELARRCVLAGSPQGGIVLDPFSGSGTTALVARNHQRHAIGIELNEEYLRIAADRLAQQSLLTGEAA